MSSALPSSSSAAAPPQDDQDWLYQHHLCETAMLVTSLVFRGEEGEEDHLPTAAGTVLLGKTGKRKERRFRIGRGRAARAAAAAAAIATQAYQTHLPSDSYHPQLHTFLDMPPPGLELPSGAPSAAGDLAPLPRPRPAFIPAFESVPALLSSTTSPSTSTTTKAETTTTREDGKKMKEGWMVGVSKRAFYKRRRKARQAAEFVVDLVLEKVDRLVSRGLAGAGEE